MLSALTSWFIKLSLVGKVATGVVALAAVGVGAAPLAGCSSPAIYADNTKVASVPYSTTLLKDGSQQQGQTKVKVAGIDGSETATHRYFYRCNVAVTKQPITQVMLVGNKHEVAETQPVPFGQQQVLDNKLFKGETKSKSAGVEGVKTLTYQVSQDEGQPEVKQLIREEITTPPVDEIIGYGPACDPNYTPCVPNVSYNLNCPDIGFSVRVIGYDRQGFDGNDNDGYGCESY